MPLIDMSKHTHVHINGLHCGELDKLSDRLKVIESNQEKIIVTLAEFEARLDQKVAAAKAELRTAREKETGEIKQAILEAKANGEIPAEKADAFLAQIGSIGSEGAADIDKISEDAKQPGTVDPPPVDPNQP